MSKIIVIARREFNSMIATKAFLLTMVMIVLLIYARHQVRVERGH